MSDAGLLYILPQFLHAKLSSLASAVRGRWNFIKLHVTALKYIKKSLLKAYVPFLAVIF